LGQKSGSPNEKVDTGLTRDKARALRNLLSAVGFSLTLAPDTKFSMRELQLDWFFRLSEAEELPSVNDGCSNPSGPAISYLNIVAFHDHRDLAHPI